LAGAQRDYDIAAVARYVGAIAPEPRRLRAHVEEDEFSAGMALRFRPEVFGLRLRACRAPAHALAEKRGPRRESSRRSNVIGRKMGAHL
jgi:hypothetical protein